MDNCFSIDFDKKVYMYKTAFSPLYDTYVGIKSVYKDDGDDFILSCTVVGYGDRQFLFRDNELENYVL